MKPILLSLFLCLSLSVVSCKQNSEPVPGGDLTPTTTICEAPAAIDMGGAVTFGDGTPGSITQSALQTLINNGGKIVFNGGAAPVTLTLSATLMVDARKEVIIDGRNLLTISGNNAVRIFDKGAPANQGEGTLFAVQNMSLINGRTGEGLGGAAIRGNFFGSLKVHNVTFRDNQGPLSDGDACGAVWTGGYKEASFSNCIFNNNRAANGGAVGAIGSGMSFVNCRFEGNEATGTGGTFDKGGQGGAVYVDGTYQNGVNNRLTLCGCQFKNNRAGHQGGGYNVVQYDGKGGSGSIDKCTFENNRCDKTLGGGVYYQDGDLSITNSTFAGNTAPGQGGGIWYLNGNLTLANCTLRGNKAGDDKDGLGGGLCLSGGGRRTVAVTNCTFAENQAGNFASAIFNGASLTLTNTLFYKNAVGNGSQGNPYGGAVINKQSSLTVGSGNLQFPAGFTGQYGTEARDYWLTGTVLTDDAGLQSLTDNGGPTPTMALPAGSPAIGKGASGAPQTDQRGRTRRNPPDIGAFEAVQQ